MRREVFVFDLDDTLYPERDYVASGFRATDRWLTEHRGIRGFFDAAWSRFQSGARGNVFDIALADLRAQSGPELIAQLVSVYRAHEPELRAYEDAETLLEELRGQHRIAILTDGYAEVQRKKVSALRLEQRVDAIVYSDDLGGRDAWKPSTLPYEALMRRLQCPGHHCIYIADNPQKDFLAAKRLGWRTIRVRRAGGEHAHVTVSGELEAAQCVETLLDVPRVLGMSAAVSA